MKILKEQKLETESYVQNVKIKNVTNREQYNLTKNNVIRTIIVYANIIQIYGQVYAILKPIEKSNQVVVNLYYCAYSLLASMFILLSFKYKANNNFVTIGTVLLSYKCNIRVFDFEKTKDLMNFRDWEDIVSN